MSHNKDVVEKIDGLVIQLGAIGYHGWHVEGILYRENLGSISEDLEAGSPVQVELSVSAQEGKWQISGILRARGVFRCSKCLDPFAGDLRVDVDRFFAVGVDPARREKSREMEADLTFSENGLLPIEELVREEILLDWPMMPVCRETCRGLCPRCGVNRNQEGCDCSSRVEDGPFSVLKKLEFS